ncbi:MAG: hypothetical protein ACKVX7_11500 [Planctomycetota bacterium]
MRHVLMLAAACIAGLTYSTLDGAVFYLADGKTLKAAYIGEANGEVTVLDEHGDMQKLSKLEIATVDWSQQLSASLEARAARERGTWLVKRQRAARAVLKRFERAAEAERAAVVAELEAFSEAELIPALGAGLLTRAAHVQNFSLERLKRSTIPSALVALVKGRVEGREPAVAASCQQAAVAKDPELSRRLFEYVSTAGPIAHRLEALSALRTAGDRRSAGVLVRVLGYVQADIRATLGRLKNMKVVPVNLSGGMNLPIELPEMELIEVMTTAQVPFESLQVLERNVVDTLVAVTGQNFGADRAAWTNWWEREGSKSPPPSEPTKPATAPGG